MASSSIVKLTDKIIRWDIALLTFLLPLFFLPFTATLFEINKQALLVVLVSIITITWAVRNILLKNVRLTLSPVLTPLSLIALTSIISLFVVSFNKPQAFITQPLNYLTLTLLFLVITTRLNKASQVHSVLSALTISASLLSFLSILSFSGLIAQIPNAPAWLTSKTFTPAGGSLPLLIFLTPLLFLSLPQALLKSSKLKHRLISITITALIATAIGLSLINIKQTQNFGLLTFSTAWEISLENFKSGRTALFGQGPNSFVSAFTNFKPISFNRTDVWQFSFDTSRNFPLYILTTIGIFGLLSYLWLVLLIYKSSKKSLKSKNSTSLEKSLSLSLLVILLSQFFFPVSILNLFLFFLLLALKQVLQKLETQTSTRDVQIRLFAIDILKPDQTPTQEHTHPSEILPWIIGVPLSLGILISLYLGATRIYAAEISYKKSLDATRANNGTQTYNMQTKAIQQNPWSSRYRATFALTNLALANSIAGKEDLNQTDRQNITQLVSQSIQEAKFATQINPRLTSNWKTLANIYRTLIGSAEGAKDWAIAAYVQAIRTDPNNPILRLELGGIYFGSQEYEEAIRFFEQAILLKPDWPNAHYNLSSVYETTDKLEKAVEEMRLTLQLLDPASADFAKAQTQLQELNDQLGQTTADIPPTQGQLNQPEPLPTPAPPNQQINLPEDAGPNVATQSANPNPQPSPTPAPTPQP